MFLHAYKLLGIKSGLSVSCMIIATIVSCDNGGGPSEDIRYVDLGPCMILRPVGSDASFYYYEGPEKGLLNLDNYCAYGECIHCGAAEMPGVIYTTLQSARDSDLYKNANLADNIEREHELSDESGESVRTYWNVEVSGIAACIGVDFDLSVVIVMFNSPGSDCGERSYQMIDGYVKKKTD